MGGETHGVLGGWGVIGKKKFIKGHYCLIKFYSLGVVGWVGVDWENFFY